MSTKRWIALLVAFVLLVGSLAINTLSMAAFTNFGSMFEEEDTRWSEHVIEKGDPGVTGKIAVLNVNGTIQETYDAPLFMDTSSYRHRTFLSMLEHAGEDPNVEGIIIRVNSPGGGVVESAEVHDKIIEVQEEFQKPIYISMGSMAASGGYYIAAPADKIVANASTITGSLGVIFQSLNVSELADEYGIKLETIKSGPYKDIMSPTREMLDEERAILQSMLDESYDEFVRIIASGRNLSEARVRELADGRIYSGLQAKELDLIDEIGSFDDTVDLLVEEIDRGRLDVIRYETPFGFNSFFMMSAEKWLTADHDLLGIKELLNRTNSPTLMYLYTR
ncbi:signal peptide peptidase SppA [Bacillus sp. FJAT-45350]|uniref:signal peptide peptidase SppA n=1 Tax=Bacillus sp. FJAT-45350 TaxID=2011014 RepID=UPI000BB913DE|nr:signal peptide peptidase SppA [Bacillus sp. FJAT-45350]